MEAETDKTEAQRAEAAKAAAEEDARRGQERFDKIVAALKEKNVNEACPRCNTTKWGLQEIGLLVNAPGATEFLLPPPNIAVVVAYCQHCGWLAMHHAKTLGVE